MKNILRKQFPLSNDKNILLYYVYSALYGLYPINAVVALFFLFKGLNYAQIGIVFTVFSLSAFFFEIPTGVLADKFGRKKSVLAGLITLTLVAFVWTLATNYLHFAFLAAVWMLGFGFISGSFEAYIYDHLTANNELPHYDGVLAKSSMLFSYFGSIGAIVGTFLYSINHNFPYYLLSLTFFLSAVAVMFMDDDDVSQNKKEGERINMWAGLRAITTSPQLKWVTAFIAIFFGYYHFFINSVNTPYILSLHVFDIRFLGVFWAVIGIVHGTISNQFDFIRKHFSDTQILIILSLVQIVGLLVMGHFFGIIGLIAIFIYVQIEPFEQMLLNSFSQKFMQKHIRATTLSTMKFVGAVVASGMGYTVGSLIDKVGVNNSFTWIACCFIVVMTILFGIKQKFAIKL